jgi:hypothetical protein
MLVGRWMAAFFNEIFSDQQMPYPGEGLDGFFCKGVNVSLFKWRF